MDRLGRILVLTLICCSLLVGCNKEDTTHGSSDIAVVVPSTSKKGLVEARDNEPSTPKVLLPEREQSDSEVPDSDKIVDKNETNRKPDSDKLSSRIMIKAVNDSGFTIESTDSIQVNNAHAVLTLKIDMLPSSWDVAGLKYFNQTEPDQIILKNNELSSIVVCKLVSQEPAWNNLLSRGSIYYYTQDSKRNGVEVTTVYAYKKINGYIVVLSLLIDNLESLTSTLDSLDDLSYCITTKSNVLGGMMIPNLKIKYGEWLYWDLSMSEYDSVIFDGTNGLISVSNKDAVTVVSISKDKVNIESNELEEDIKIYRNTIGEKEKEAVE